MNDTKTDMQVERSELESVCEPHAGAREHHKISLAERGDEDAVTL